MDCHWYGEDGSRGLSTSIDKESGSNTTISSDTAVIETDPVDESATPLNEFHGHKALTLKELEDQSPVLSAEKTVVEDDLPEYEWDEHPARELEVLLNNNMYAIIETAIHKVVECGYSTVAASWAVLHSGLSRGSKDVLSNIVDGALEMLKTENECNIPKKPVFDGLKRMVEYMVLEMTNVILETRPDWTAKEAMHCLLKNDMNLSTACPAEERASQTSHSDDEIPGKKPMPDSTSSCPNTPIPSPPPHPPKCKTYPGTKWNKVSISIEEMRTNLRVAREHIRLMAAQAGETRNEKSGISKKGKSKKSRRKAFPFERDLKHRASQDSSKAKFSVLGNVMLEKTLKSQSDLLTKVAEANASTSNTPAPALPVKGPFSAATKAKSNPPQDPRLKAKTNVPEPVQDTTDYYAGIPYDETLQKHIPRDEKDQHILTLVPLKQDLEKKLQFWSDWAKEKVTQTTKRLARDQGELKKMRQEKAEEEKLNKEKQAMEDSSNKRILEMQTALAKANNQIEVANAYFQKLQEENSSLRTRMGVSRLRATQSCQLLEDAIEREQDAIRKCQSLETEKGLCMDQLESAKNKISELNNQLGKMKERQLRFEALLRKEEREKLKAIASFEYLQSKKEEDEAVARAKAESMTYMAETNIKKTEDDIQNLERTISELRLNAQRSRTAALSFGYGSCASSSSDDFFTFRALQQPQTTESTFGSARARECVMCMHKETSVVFLPCAHQVLCVECNILHERQGMNGCPSCRATIERRIPAQFRQV